MKFNRPPLILAALLAGLTATASQAQDSAEALFKAECSACHMAYPAGFLPIRSWQAIMADLPNHFGEDASLTEDDRATIEAYLVANAADRNGRMPRWLKSLPDDAVPMRISELSWFTHEHGNRVANRIKTDPTIGSVANCVACHKGAERGYFDDD